MTLVYIYWGSYAGFGATLACANARAGCPIITISDSGKPGNSEHIHLKEFRDALMMREKLAATVGNWCSYSLARWFVLLELGRKRPEIFPVFCADWDVMVFQDLNKSYSPFMECDFTVSIDGKMSSAAYGMNRVGPLNALCELIGRDSSDKHLNDMEATARLSREGQWNVGNLFEIKNDSVFDHNIVCGNDRFKMNGDCKQVRFKDCSPYFVTHAGPWVVANTIHCWGPYKSKPKELLKHAAIPL